MDLETSQQKEKAEKFLFLGPLFLLLSLSLAVFTGNYELVPIVIVSLLMLWRFRVKGLYAALALLFVCAFWRHLSLPLGHFWHLGLESTVGIGFVISAMSMEEILQKMEGYKTNIKKHVEFKQEMQLTLIEKEKENETNVSQIQDLYTQEKQEHEKVIQKRQSLQDLVDAIRHTEDENREKKEALILEISQKTQKLSSLKSEIQDLKINPGNSTDQDNLKKKNSDLLQKLNEARVQKYQTHLINETLAKLLAKESKKVKMQDENLRLKGLEKEGVYQELEHTKSEVHTLCKSLEAASIELEKTRNEKTQDLERVQALTAECEDFKKQLTQSDLVENTQDQKDLIASLKEKEDQLEKLTQEKGSVVQIQNECNHLQKKLQEKEEILQNYEKRLDEIKQIEPTLFQLRKQFDEKSKILHETRAELFQSQSEVMSLKAKEENRKLWWNPEIDKIYREAAEVEKELEQVRKENKELLQIISKLNPKDPPPDSLPLY